MRAGRDGWSAMPAPAAGAESSWATGAAAPGRRAEPDRLRRRDPDLGLILRDAARAASQDEGRGRVVMPQISAAPEPSRPGGLRNERPARPWQNPRRRS